MVGGPEVSYETDQQALCSIADYVVTGAADLRFADLCNDLLLGHYPPSKSCHLFHSNLTGWHHPTPSTTMKISAHASSTSRLPAVVPSSANSACRALIKQRHLSRWTAFYRTCSACMNAGQAVQVCEPNVQSKVDSCIRILDFFLSLDCEEDRSCTLN